MLLQVPTPYNAHMARQRTKKPDLEKLKIKLEPQKPAVGHSPARAAQTHDNKRRYDRKRDKRVAQEE
jgi:hypothetical protein